MATRANAAVSILRNSRVSPARSHPDLVISGSLKCPPFGNDWEAAYEYGVLAKTAARWSEGSSVSYSAGLFTRGRDEILHPHGNGFILENFCKFVPLESLKRIPWIRWIENLVGATAGLSKWNTFFGNYIRCAGITKWTALTLNKDRKRMKVSLIAEERKAFTSAGARLEIINCRYIFKLKTST